MNSQINHSTFTVFRSTGHAFCYLLIFMTFRVVGSNHSTSTQASSHPISCEPSIMWHTGSLGGGPLQPSYFTDHFPLKSPEPLLLLSSVQPPLWAQPGCWTFLKGRQQVRAAGNIAAPGATTPCSFFQVHDAASCVRGGVRGSSANLPPSAAAKLRFSSLGTEGVHGCPC